MEQLDPGPRQILARATSASRNWNCEAPVAAMMRALPRAATAVGYEFGGGGWPRPGPGWPGRRRGGCARRSHVSATGADGSRFYRATSLRTVMTAHVPQLSNRASAGFMLNRRRNRFHSRSLTTASIVRMSGSRPFGFVRLTSANREPACPPRPSGSDQTIGRSAGEP